MITLEGTNIVILAKHHNPSIVSKEWLVNNKIINENENIMNFVHTPAFSVIETDIFHLTVDSDRLQIALKKTRDDNIKYWLAIIKRYINHLPQTPYRALGINFIFNIFINEKRFKKLFAGDDNLFKKIFGENYKIGGIIKFNYNDFMVRLRLEQINKKILSDFNFHLDSKDVQNIIKKIDKYYEIKKYAEEILEGLI